MTNPHDPVDVNFALNGEFYLNPKTGRTHIRLPAGGSGGGVTGYADVEATEDQHVAFLDSQAKLKEDEATTSRQRHDEAHAKREEKTELYLNDEAGHVHKHAPDEAPSPRDPRATDEEEKEFLAKDQPSHDAPRELSHGSLLPGPAANPNASQNTRL